VTLDEFKKLVEVLAYVMVAAWAVYGFFVLRQRQKAVADLRRIEIETRRAELELRRVAVVHVHIEASWTQSTDARGYYVLANVSLVNEGKKDTRLKWKDEDPPFSVWRATFAADGAPVFSGVPIRIPLEQTRDPNKRAVSTILRAGGRQQFAFAVNVSDPGIYRLAFRAVVAPDEQAISVEAGAAPTNTVAWTSTSYVVVGMAGAANALQMDGRETARY
jgi:hypothetical protein